MLGEMPLKPIQRNASLVFRIALLVLSVAVFAWGLQYKLSLYEASSHPNPVRIAKLIQAEQSKKLVAVQLQERSRFPRIAVEHGIPQFRPLVVARRNRPVDAPVLSSITVLPSFLFFRPPPRS